MDILVSPQSEHEEKVLLAFLESLQYKYETEPTGDDTTEYLLSSEANKQHIMESIEQSNKGIGSKIDLEDLFK